MGRYVRKSSKASVLLSCQGRDFVPGTLGQGRGGVHALGDGVIPVCETHTALRTRHNQHHTHTSLNSEIDMRPHRLLLLQTRREHRKLKLYLGIVADFSQGLRPRVSKKQRHILNPNCIKV